MGRIRQQAMAQPLSECGPSSPAGLPVEPVRAAASRSGPPGFPEHNPTSLDALRADTLLGLIATL